MWYVSMSVKMACWVLYILEGRMSLPYIQMSVLTEKYSVLFQIWISQILTNSTDMYKKEKYSAKRKGETNTQTQTQCKIIKGELQKICYK